MRIPFLNPLNQFSFWILVVSVDVSSTLHQFPRRFLCWVARQDSTASQAAAHRREGLECGWKPWPIETTRNGTKAFEPKEWRSVGFCRPWFFWARQFHGNLETPITNLKVVRVNFPTCTCMAEQLTAKQVVHGALINSLSLFCALKKCCASCWCHLTLRNFNAHLWYIACRCCRTFTGPDRTIEANYRISWGNLTCLTWDATSKLTEIWVCSKVESLLSQGLPSILASRLDKKWSLQHRAPSDVSFDEEKPYRVCRRMEGYPGPPETKNWATGVISKSQCRRVKLKSILSVLGRKRSGSGKSSGAGNKCWDLLKNWPICSSRNKEVETSYSH